jgi:Mrp family chromosome partitioning ATPase
VSDHIGFHGGEFRGTVIGKAEYRQYAPAPTALDALPAKPTGFTGRDEELARLRGALNPAAAGEPQAVLITAVSGLGGIGKTALAVEAAYAAQAEGGFRAGCSSSTCTGTTTPRSRRTRPLSRCFGRWGSSRDTFR